jgi:hypothetical protein
LVKYPIFVFYDANKVLSTEKFLEILQLLIGSTSFDNPKIRLKAGQVLCRLFDPLIIPYWTGVIKNLDQTIDSIDLQEKHVIEFWKISSTCINSIIKQIPSNTQISSSDITISKEIYTLLTFILSSRDVFVNTFWPKSNPVTLFPELYQANFNLETRLLINLCSNDYYTTYSAVCAMQYFTKEFMMIKNDSVGEFEKIVLKILLINMPFYQTLNELAPSPVGNISQLSNQIRLGIIKCKEPTPVF